MSAPMSQLTRRFADLLLVISAFGLVLMTAIIGWQVFGRYVLGASPSWSEQSALVLMIWYVTLAAAAGVREGFHIRIVIFENQLQGGKRQLVRCFNHGIVLLCGVAMAIWGGALVQETWSHVIPSIGLPRGFAYLGLPISGVLIALFALEKIMETLSGHENGTQEEVA